MGDTDSYLTLLRRLSARRRTMYVDAHMIDNNNPAAGQTQNRIWKATSSVVVSVRTKEEA